MFTKFALISFTILVTIVLPFIWNKYNDTYNNTNTILSSNMERVVAHAMSRSKVLLTNTDWANNNQFCIDNHYELQIFTQEWGVCENDMMNGMNKIIIDRDKKIVQIFDNSWVISWKPIRTINLWS